MKKELFTIIFGTNTRAGRIFDVVLLWMIILSVLVVILESVPKIERNYGELLIYLEYGFTLVFTIEYILRIIISPKPVAYMKSGWGIVDLLAILPVYISFLIPAYQYFIVLRLLRLMRVFRILKLFRFTAESRNIYLALKASTYKISVFLLVVFTLTVLVGTVMYALEGPHNGFTSIPDSIYWTIVTITTVGYGDITPTTVVGKMLASLIMLSGYAIIAVPTGIVTIEMSKSRMIVADKPCPNCGKTPPKDSSYCNYCGTPQN